MIRNVGESGKLKIPATWAIWFFKPLLQRRISSFEKRLYHSQELSVVWSPLHCSIHWIWLTPLFDSFCSTPSVDIVNLNFLAFHGQCIQDGLFTDCHRPVTLPMGSLSSSSYIALKIEQLELLNRRCDLKWPDESSVTMHQFSAIKRKLIFD